MIGRVKACRERQTGNRIDGGDNLTGAAARGGGPGNVDRQSARGVGGPLLSGGRRVGDKVDGDAVERGPGRVGLENDVAIRQTKVDIRLGLRAERR